MQENKHLVYAYAGAKDYEAVLSDSTLCIIVDPYGRDRRILIIASGKTTDEIYGNAVNKILDVEGMANVEERRGAQDLVGHAQ